MWKSFGFNEEEGWREDGFSLSFNAADSTVGCTAVLELANKYKQAAIYVWSCSEDGSLERKVVWCDPEKNKELSTSERMRIISPEYGRNSIGSRHYWSS